MDAADVLARYLHGAPPGLPAEAEKLDRRALQEAGRKAADLDATAGNDENRQAGINGLHGQFQDMLQKLSDSYRYRFSEARAIREKCRADLRQFKEEADREQRRPGEQTDTTAAYTDLRRLDGEFRTLARPACREYDRARFEYYNFVQDNPVTPPARYSRVPASQVAFIAASVIVEIAINAFFFLNATPRGLIGSLFEVVFFAPINVGAATVTGLFSFRYARHKQVRWRRAGIVSGILLWVFIFVFNLYLAAVRLSFEPDAPGDVATILFGILSPDILSVINYEALGIFMIGLGLAGFACFEAYRILDPYPGFTRVQRRLDEAEAEMQRLEEDYVVHLGDVEDRSVADLGKKLRGFYELAAYHRKVFELSQRDAAAERNWRTRLVDLYEAAYAEFRASYLAHPAFDDDTFPKMPALFGAEAEPDVTTTDEHEDAISQMLGALEEHYSRVRQDLHEHIATKRDSAMELLMTVIREERKRGSTVSSDAPEAILVDDLPAGDAPGLASRGR